MQRPEFCCKLVDARTVSRALHSGTLQALSALLFSLLSSHGGLPAEARILQPSTLSIVDADVDIVWDDFDAPIPTGTATVNLFYTNRLPPTFFPGQIPDALTGTVVASGILEADLTNRVTFDTRLVAAGTYWVWSRVDEPPERRMSPQYISFSPPITVQHAADGLHPAVRITRPRSPVDVADTSFEIRYDARATAGTVRLDVGFLGDYTTIASGLPADLDRSWVWDTTNVPERDWTIRAVVTDDVGTSTAYAPVFLLVAHDGPRPDAGPSDSGVEDASAFMALDPDPTDGCDCRVGHTSHEPAALGAMLLLFVGWRMRRGR